MEPPLSRQQKNFLKWFKEAKKRKNNMTSKVYDILKWTTLIAFPAFIALYGVIAATWGFPYTEQILTTLAASNAFLGAVLGVSNINYHKSN